MSKQQLWYGFLEAGAKSSPVVIDHSIETGDKNTVYIYNHNKEGIIKYSRELVEPKLRELTSEESDLKSTLAKGFTNALKTFKSQAKESFSTPATARQNYKTETIEDEQVDLDDVQDIIWVDGED